MQTNLKELQQRSQFINCQRHPSLPLLVWNYTRKCQYEHAWDDYTMVARGLVTDLEGNYVARPFKKFFNLGERNETQVERLVDIGEPKVYEKLDGSLGIQYYDGDIPQIATRGSFTSDQALWASGWIETRFTKNDFLEGHTYLYEIIYPENRIVVDYRDRAELVLLSVVETETGKEIDYIPEAERLGLSYAQPINKPFTELQEYVHHMNANEEGFVLLYPNGLRVKLKGEEYLRLHKIVFSLSTKTVWEKLKEGQYDGYDYRIVPEHFRVWLREVENKIYTEYENHVDNVQVIWEEIARQRDHNISRKMLAKHILTQPKQYQAVLFNWLDNKSSNDLIWNLVKPKFERPKVLEEIEEVEW